MEKFKKRSLCVSIPASIAVPRVASCAAAFLSLIALGAPAQEANPADLVGALNGVFGKHSGQRATHAKGTCVVGSFVSSGNAAELSSAKLFQVGAQMLVTGRFSVGGGNPAASDKGKTVRGLALRFGARDAPELDLVLVSAPVFMVATPDEFMGFMAARRPDPATGKADPALVKAFNDAHPSTRAQIQYLNTTPVTASYATSAFWGVNAFHFLKEKKQTAARWRAEPVAGRRGLTDAELALLPDDFLKDELSRRLTVDAVEFDLMLQVANAEDDVRNPTVAWPASRKEVNAGRLRIESVQSSTASADSGCEALMFNPAQLPSGIALSDDPTLKVRAAAYAVSLSRRLQR